MTQHPSALHGVPSDGEDHDRHELDGHDQQVLDWTDLGREMWSFLTGRDAAINYRFVDMLVEVPRDTGPQAPRATWRLNGSLQVTTSDATVRGQAGGR